MKREQEEKDVKLQQQLNLHKEKEKVLNECINLLTAKLVKSNQNESTSCQSNLKTNEIEIDGDKPEVEGPAAKVAKLEKVITSYQRITGISIKVQDPQGAEDEVLVCTAKNSNRRLLTRFLLTKEMSNDEIILIPEANIHLLPIYLQEGASFLPALAPLLMGDILVSLFAENDATV